ncbi:nucleoside/nucleotide kinase family protein [Catellatospora sp. TT07R-123]|uniref:nucleoside/nucleotide kinase family protein n=1 Tax=Catellatospora sp. TT07R-123 TaxID=2733863 RepID=UPI001B0657A3|nr:nucleoside/nucleotide kinase family protein [Catellatospora sp. TT07R-123]GHJ44676.1 nucleoside/nucleotide kinase family protein [Catellatospora sp. TT07R-123]
MLTKLLEQVHRLREGRPGRLFVGITGAPGAGKSTLAQLLAQRLDRAAVVPMDGFHLANAELRRLGRADRKGAPDTFDAAGYAALLRRLRDTTDETVWAPTFDHVLNEPVAGAVPVPPEADVVITEGNYLLLDVAPWDRVRGLLDLAVYLSADDAERVDGLLARQLAKGLDEAAARDWVLRSDEANARLVATTAARADLRLHRA